MPPRSVPRRVEDIIYYYYAKLIIAPSAGFEGNYRFIIHAYQRLKSGEIRMSDYERELSQIAEEPSVCAFCGHRCADLRPTHVVPRSLGVPAGMHNLVMACSTCAESKEGKNLVQWWCEDLGKPRDELPRLPLGIYLKIAYELHKIGFSLKNPCGGLSEVFQGFRSG